MRPHFRILATLVAWLMLSSASEQAVASTGDALDRSTPRRAVAAFLVALEHRDYSAAATLMDLSAIAPESRDRRGPELATQLYHVLEQNLWIEPDMLSDDPQGNVADGVDTERIGVVRSDGVDVPITLTRLPSSEAWVVSAATVARIPRLYAEYEPGFVESRVPSAFRARVWGLAAWQWLGVLVAMLVAFAIGRVVVFVGSRIGRRLAERTVAQWDDELVEALRRPARFFVGVLAFDELISLLALPAAAKDVLARVLGMITIGAVAWAVIGIIGVASRMVERHAMEAANGAGDASLRARGIKTQVRVLRRVVNIAVGTLATALMLTQFEAVRTVGVSLLASAGVAGVVLGFAAQRTIGSLIAGIQLSFTQPIRIGDVVIVEKEWGTIEEVTLTFVVVRVWDERRLIVPMSRFLEQPFENWTKVSAELHGTVFFHVDWKLPIDDMRRELDRIVVGNPKWDGRTKGIVVTNTTDRTIEVRALVSAANSGDLWNLRTEVRERIVAWLREHEGGRYLPRIRIDDDATSRAEDRAR